MQKEQYKKANLLKSCQKIEKHFKKALWHQKNRNSSGSGDVSDGGNEFYLLRRS